MGIRAQELEVWNYRSFESYGLELDPGVTILVGRNAAGKTNLVEAIQLLTSGRSFRHPRAADLLRCGCARGRMDLLLVGDGREVEIACMMEDGKRAFERNGKRVKASGVRGVLPSVLFCPDHLDLVKGSASVRRAAVDDFGVQLNAQYAKLVQSYGRIVEQRNNLLKDEFCPDELLAAWDESLVGTGSSLLMHRVALVERLRTRFAQVYSSVAPHERADMVYECSIGEPPRSREEAMERFREALQRRRAEERRRGVTLVGPHRDEVLISVGDRPARSFASQGQQRSIVLAWKIAEVQVVRDILGCDPILLLDDVMSELDEGRREAVMSFVGDGMQTVITTTNLGYFSEGVLSGASVVEVGHG